MSKASPQFKVDADALLLPAAEAARRCSMSRATWWRHHAAGKVPAPRRVGGKVLWCASELLAWAEAGCPSRAEWEGMKQ